MFPLLNVFEKIGMKNIWGLVIMYGGFGMSMSIFLYHGFMKSVPVSLEEAAVLDGAGAIQIFLKVVFPLVKGTTSTVIILNALWIWNDYLLPFMVIGNGEIRTMTLELYFCKDEGRCIRKSMGAYFPFGACDHYTDYHCFSLPAEVYHERCC